MCLVGKGFDLLCLERWSAEENNQDGLGETRDCETVFCRRAVSPGAPRGCPVG